MPSTSQIKQDIQQYFGNRGKLKLHETGIFGDLKKPEKLGLFFCIATKSELDSIRKMIPDIDMDYKSLSVNIFCLTTDSLDVITHPAVFTFNLADFNLMAKKGVELQSRFDSEHYDLLISFIFEPDLFCRKLISDWSAAFKAGPKHQDAEMLYDLIVKTEDNETNYLGFYKQVKHYIEALNLNSTS